MRSLKIRALFFSFVVALLLCSVPVWVRWSTRHQRFTRIKEVPSAQVAIVLGAFVEAKGQPSDILLDRLWIARELYRAGKVSKILVSGDHGRASYDEVNSMHRWLLKRGVQSKDIFLDHAGFTTLDTMQRASKVFGVHDAIICTQAFHLPRAVFLASAAGIKASGIEADRRVYLGTGWNAVRETMATHKAWAATYVLHKTARHLGPRIPITGDARSTHDTRTLTGLE